MMGEVVKGLCKKYLVNMNDDVDEVVGHDDLIIIYANRQNYSGLVDETRNLAILDSANIDEHKLVVRNK